MKVKYLNLPAQFDIEAILGDIREELKSCRFILDLRFRSLSLILRNSARPVMPWT